MNDEHGPTHDASWAGPDDDANETTLIKAIALMLYGGHDVTRQQAEARTLALFAELLDAPNWAYLTGCVMAEFDALWAGAEMTDDA